MNEKAVKLLQEVINKNYKNIELENINFDDEFYYEFKSSDKVSENDFKKLEKEIHELDNSMYVKLLRISGVYLDGNKENEMIKRIRGKAVNSIEE